MKALVTPVLFLLLAGLLSSCAKYTEYPEDVRCPACYYMWDNTPTESD